MGSFTYKPVEGALLTPRQSSSTVAISGGKVNFVAATDTAASVPILPAKASAVLGMVAGAKDLEPGEKPPPPPMVKAPTAATPELDAELEALKKAEEERVKKLREEKERKHAETMAIMNQWTWETEKKAQAPVALAEPAGDLISD